MKISSKIFSIPPYISTRWEYVISLRVADNLLIVTLKDGTMCSIPNLQKEIIDQIFTCHAESAEATNHQKEDLGQLVEGMRSGFKELVSMLTKLGTNALSSLGKALEHDPNTTNLPELPPDMVKKVQMLLNIIPKEDILSMPEGEPGCHCMYCQINKILRESLKIHETSKPDIVAEGEIEDVEEKDLEFSEWIVEPIQDKLYKVTNKLDHQEEYRVFLGDPIGCTCGKPHCEHVLAVLKS
jgi:hypothetical protein